MASVSVYNINSAKSRREDSFAHLAQTIVGYVISHDVIFRPTRSHLFREVIPLFSLDVHSPLSYSQTFVRRTMPPRITIELRFVFRLRYISRVPLFIVLRNRRALSISIVGSRNVYICLLV